MQNAYIDAWQLDMVLKNKVLQWEILEELPRKDSSKPCGEYFIFHWNCTWNIILWFELAVWNWMRLLTASLIQTSWEYSIFASLELYQAVQRTSLALKLTNLWAWAYHLPTLWAFLSDSCVHLLRELSTVRNGIKFNIKNSTTFVYTVCMKVASC